MILRDNGYSDDAPACMASFWLKRYSFAAYVDRMDLTGGFMPINDLSFRTPAELQAILGNQIRNLRHFRNLDQRRTAEKAGISEKAPRNLEAGRGSTVETLLRTLKSLDFLEGIDLLAPDMIVSPMALLRHPKPRQRIRQPRT